MHGANKFKKKSFQVILEYVKGHGPDEDLPTKGEIVDQCEIHQGLARDTAKDYIATLVRAGKLNTVADEDEGVTRYATPGQAEQVTGDE